MNRLICMDKNRAYTLVHDMTYFKESNWKQYVTEIKVILIIFTIINLTLARQGQNRVISY